MKSLLSFVLLLFLLVGAWWWLDSHQPEIQTELRETLSTRIETTQIVQEDIQLSTRITGRLIPAQHAKLHFEVSGQVLERKVEPGQKVVVGDELIRIDAGEFEDVLNEMQIQFDQEKAVIKRDRTLLDLVNRQVTLLQQEVERQEKLKKQSLTSQSRIDETRRQLLGESSEQARLRHSVNTAESRLKMHKVAIKKAQRNIRRTVLSAPIKATINSVEISVGDYVSPGQAVIELVQVDELDLAIAVAGNNLAALSLGQKVVVSINGKQHQGTLYSIQYDPDPITHTHGLKVRLNGQGLFPGQLGEVLLTGKTMTAAFVVPVTAVLSEDGEHTLFRVENDHVARVSVRIEGRYKDKLMITGAIKLGDKIVARDVAALENNQQVTSD